MPDIDMEILRLFHPLDTEQKQEIISLALSMLATELEGTPSDQQSTIS